MFVGAALAWKFKMSKVEQSLYNKLIAIRHNSKVLQFFVKVWNHVTREIWRKILLFVLY